MEEPQPPSFPLAELARNLPLGDLLALGAQSRESLSPEGLLNEVVAQIHRVLGYPQVYVRLRNPDTDELEACAFAGVPVETAAQLTARPLAPTVYQRLLQPRFRLNDSFLIPADEPLAGTFQTFDEALRDGGGTLLVPLRGRNDRLLGLLYVALTSPAPPGQADVQLLETIARQAALALEQARIATRTARLLAKEQLLSELGRDISDTLELERILARTTDRLAAVFQGGAIALINEQQELVIVAGIGAVDSAARNVRLRLGEGITGWVALTGLPHLANDTRGTTRIAPAALDVGSNALVRAYIAVPLRSGGRVIGTLSVEAHEPGAFTYEDLDLVEAVAAQIGGPIASATLHRRTEQLAVEVRRRNEQLLVLNTIARAAVSTLELDRMLATVAAQIQQGFGYDHVEVHTVDEDDGVYTLAAQAGPFAPNKNGTTQLIGTGLLGEAHRAGRTVRVDDVRAEPIYLGSLESETRAEVCVPVKIGGRVLAILNLEERQVGAFTAEDVSALETAADVLAGAIENARLYERAQAAAVLEERSRLARDLHDSVSQQLFSMTLTAQAARAQLEKNPARASAQLERLQETAQAALAEMRALIFQLRPPGLAEQGLVGALQQHAAAIGRREGLAIEFRVSGEERHARGVEQAIYRIVQEALNNIAKHAGATEAEVALSLQPGAIQLSVRDNGRGFDMTSPATGGGQHLGLTSMQERAAEIGGALTVRSAPGQGTTVALTLAREPNHPQ